MKITLYTANDEKNNADSQQTFEFSRWTYLQHPVERILNEQFREMMKTKFVVISKCQLKTDNHKHASKHKAIPFVTHQNRLSVISVEYPLRNYQQLLVYNNDTKSSNA